MFNNSVLAALFPPSKMCTAQGLMLTLEKEVQWNNQVAAGLWHKCKMYPFLLWHTHRSCDGKTQFDISDSANLSTVEPVMNSIKSALHVLLITTGSKEKKSAEKLDTEGTVFDDVTLTLNTR